MENDISKDASQERCLQDVELAGRSKGWSEELRRSGASLPQPIVS